MVDSWDLLKMIVGETDVVGREFKREALPERAYEDRYLPRPDSLVPIFLKRSKNFLEQQYPT